MSLRVLRCPPRGRCACGPAKPVPRPVLVLNAVRLFSFLLLAMLAWLPAGAQAESVALAGMLGSKALLVVNGTAPKTVAAGETHQGVKVISTSGDQAVVEQTGQRQTLRVGQAPVSLGGASGSRIVLPKAAAATSWPPARSTAVPCGSWSIPVRPASALSTQDAESAGINYKNGQAVQISTANGAIRGFRLKLDSVRAGDVELYGVDAVVTPQPMPFVLLGNSFLSRFQMKRDNNLMTLDKRY